MIKGSVTFINLALQKGDKGRVIRVEGVVPENVNETPSAPSYTPHNIPGRSSPIFTYTGGEARSVSFSLTLHRDIIISNDYSRLDEDYIGLASNNTVDHPIPKVTVSGGWKSKVFKTVGNASFDQLSVMQNNYQGSDRFNELINRFKAMNYPRYSKAGVVPPLVYCQLGGDIRIKGQPNITVDYQGPIDARERYMVVTINVSITEMLQKSFSNVEVVKGMTRYQTYSKSINTFTSKH